MSTTNNVFKFPERASYELGHLLRALPQHLAGSDLTEHQQLEIEAADLHALNASGILLHGLQSLGRVMWSASVNEKFPVDAEDYGKVCLLVTEVALQLQFLDEFRQSVMQHELRAANALADTTDRATSLVEQREATDTAARAAGLRHLGATGGAA